MFFRMIKALRQWVRARWRARHAAPREASGQPGLLPLSEARRILVLRSSPHDALPELRKLFPRAEWVACCFRNGKERTPLSGTKSYIHSADFDIWNLPKPELVRALQADFYDLVIQWDANDTWQESMERVAEVIPTRLRISFVVQASLEVFDCVMEHPQLNQGDTQQILQLISA
mgnify:CR=1 FL=1